MSIDFSKLRLMVVDDEPFMRGLIRRILQDIGVSDVVEARNGMQAFSLLASDLRNFDLIICDLNMPTMDGFHFVHYLRQEQGNDCADLPVLILTGHTRQESVEMAVKLGISGYVAKPVSRNVLKSRIEAALNGPRVGLAMRAGGQDNGNAE